jgi:GNAT superfamily N-acetyltransferase
LPLTGHPSLELIVHPQHRRRGVGTRLLDEVFTVARRQGRSLIEVEAVRGLPDGPGRDEAGYRYLTNRGHQPAMTSVRSRCRIGEDGEQQPLPYGYSLVQWRDGAPDDIVGDVAALQSRLTLDGLSGDVAVERMRGQDAVELGRGFRWYSTAARHDASGRIVARTKVSFEWDDDTYARQRITLVEPDHRGRRLGPAVKSANHAYARRHEPALLFVDAWNAEDNAPMRAVNAALGFRPVDAWAAFQLPVPSFTDEFRRVGRSSHHNRLEGETS